MTIEQAKQKNPVTLAFLGDAVYTLWVRQKLVERADAKPSDLQRTAAQIVSARGQSAFLEELIPLLTEEENGIFRRGKNAKKPTHSKGATALEYNRSTGFEAVLGFLYLTGNDARIKELLQKSDERDFAAIAVVQPFKPVHH